MFCFKIYAFFLFWFKHTRSVCTLYDYNKQYSLVVFGYSCISFPKSNKGLVGKLQSNLTKLVRTTAETFHNTDTVYDTYDHKKTSIKNDDNRVFRSFPLVTEFSALQHHLAFPATNTIGSYSAVSLTLLQAQAFTIQLYLRLERCNAVPRVYKRCRPGTQLAYSLEPSVTFVILISSRPAALNYMHPSLSHMDGPLLTNTIHNSIPVLMLHQIILGVRAWFRRRWIRPIPTIIVLYKRW